MFLFDFKHCVKLVTFVFIFTQGGISQGSVLDGQLIFNLSLYKP